MSTRLESIFQAMKNRCYNSNNPAYKNYGGRGIKLCEEWNNREIARNVQRNNTKGFLAFKKWALENGYTDNLTIDRIDVNGDYSPENCRWVNRKIQGNNRRNNHYITYKGKTQSLADWCRELCLNYHKIRSRLNKYNWSVDKAFETD